MFGFGSDTEITVVRPEGPSTAFRPGDVVRARVRHPGANDEDVSVRLIGKTVAPLKSTDEHSVFLDLKLERVVPYTHAKEGPSSEDRSEPETPQDGLGDQFEVQIPAAEPGQLLPTFLSPAESDRTRNEWSGMSVQYYVRLEVIRRGMVKRTVKSKVRIEVSYPSPPSIAGVFVKADTGSGNLQFVGSNGETPEVQATASRFKTYCFHPELNGTASQLSYLPLSRAGEPLHVRLALSSSTPTTLDLLSSKPMFARARISRHVYTKKKHDPEGGSAYTVQIPGRTVVGGGMQPAMPATTSGGGGELVWEGKFVISEKERNVDCEWLRICYSLTCEFMTDSLKDHIRTQCRVFLPSDQLDAVQSAPEVERDSRTELEGDDLPRYNIMSADVQAGVDS